MQIPWKQFVELIRSGRYNEGVALLIEDKIDFGGPISSIEVTNEGVSVAISPCATRTMEDWQITHPEGRVLLLSFSRSLGMPSLDHKKELSFVVDVIKSVYLYPKDHPLAAPLLVLGVAATT